MPKLATPPDGFLRGLDPDGLEGRAVGPAPQTRAQTDEAPPQIYGYASLFNVPALIEGWFWSWEEMVAPGAWTKTLKESASIKSMFNHDSGRLLATTDSGTARFSEDSTGLYYEVDVDMEDPFAASVYRQVELGKVKGASIHFRVVKELWEDVDEDEDRDVERRTILEGQLFEGGPVVFPAFIDTTAGTRSMNAVTGVLRAAGVPEKTRSRLKALAWSDPEALEQELRRILESQPVLREAVCSCNGNDVQVNEGKPPKRHSPGHLEIRARGIAARDGLPT